MGHRRSRTSDQAATLRRASVGLLAAVSLVLVAFEWRSGPSILPVFDHGLDLEDDHDPMPVVLQRRDPAPRALKEKRIRTSTAVVMGDPDTAHPSGDPAPDPGTTGVVAPNTFKDMNPPEVPDPGPLPWAGVEQRPYFRSYLSRPRTEIDACTEEGIERFLRMEFKVPERMRGEEFTVVTFVIDADGGIGRVVCVPRPRADVAEEIERVMRAMPAFMPATQNGRAVPVVYQIPFRVARR